MNFNAMISKHRNELISNGMLEPSTLGLYRAAEWAAEKDAERFNRHFRLSPKAARLIIQGDESVDIRNLLQKAALNYLLEREHEINAMLEAEIGA